MPKHWSRQEVEATVADYFAMWAKELRREQFNKAQHNRALRALLQDRTKQAVDFKQRNISAILIELGYQYIDGYKPAGNYQQLLRDVVVAMIQARPELGALAQASAESPAVAQSVDSRWEDLIVAPPERSAVVEPYLAVRQAPVRPLKMDYLELESRNRSLGLAGEQFVLSIEEQRLRSAGKTHLANRIEHVSRTNDGAGYDILSFETDERERLIEVKTTRGGDMTPFYASRNEVAVSEERAEQFRLFRVFAFETRPRAFVLPGSLRNSVALEPVTFKASIRG
jgi:hypothetical protein